MRCDMFCSQISRVAGGAKNDQVINFWRWIGHLRFSLTTVEYRNSRTDVMERERSSCHRRGRKPITQKKLIWKVKWNMESDRIQSKYAARASYISSRVVKTLQSCKDSFMLLLSKVSLVSSPQENDFEDAKALTRR